ncbi:ABC transporter substrate-binding protein [Parenemella sanctibonifatiensis]|uniref:ABC transporter substrate-binding protein n=1 Tax=Parenemella sanctibonifatiensis TaxID=2016505 RepID=UPI0015C5B407|nr:extracellular solute-binding protein [Parenemella sanctibonifatiensis]
MGTPGGGGGGGDGTLRITWWGGEGENRALTAALDLYADREDGRETTRETLPWDGYWEKLATTTAARNAPDVVMQAGSQIPDYSERGALLDLNTLDGLDTTVVDEGLQSFGAVGDELFGVVAAANAYGITVNRQLAPDLEIPDSAYSWQDLADLARSLLPALDNGVRPLVDNSGDLISFILHIRSMGQELYADDGSINPLEDELGEWLTMWEGLRADGVVPTAEETAESSGGLQNSNLARQRAVMGTAWTQDYVNLAGLADVGWTIDLPPYGAEHPSLWMNAASLWSVSSTSPDPAGAGELINFLLADPEAISAVGVSLGTPPSQAARDQLTGLDETQQNAIDYMNFVADNSKPLNRLWPKGFATSRTQIEDLAEALRFGQTTVDEAVQAFFADARS